MRLPISPHRQIFYFQFTLFFGRCARVRSSHLAQAQRFCLRASHTFAFALLTKLSLSSLCSGLPHRQIFNFQFTLFFRRCARVRSSHLAQAQRFCRRGFFAPVEIKDFYVAIVVLNSLFQQKLVIAPAFALHTFAFALLTKLSLSSLCLGLFNFQFTLLLYNKQIICLILLLIICLIVVDLLCLLFLS